MFYSFLRIFLYGWENLALLTLPLRLVCAVGGKGKCAKCVRAKEIFKNAKRGLFVFFPHVELDCCQLTAKLSRLYGCLSTSFFVAVGVGLLRKCLRRTVVFQGCH
jgi:hypothetical protein